MAVKDAPGLHLQKNLHEHAYGIATRAYVEFESSSEAADDTIKLLPLDQGMRIDRVYVWVTDALGSAGTADIGYWDPADTDGNADDSSNLDFWADALDLNRVGAFAASAPPWVPTKKGMFLAIRPRVAIAANTKVVILMSYVYVGQ